MALIEGGLRRKKKKLHHSQHKSLEKVAKKDEAIAKSDARRRWQDIPGFAPQETKLELEEVQIPARFGSTKRISRDAEPLGLDDSSFDIAKFRAALVNSSPKTVLIPTHDDRRINSVTSFGSRRPPQQAYVRATKSLSTTKGRIALMAKIIEDDEDDAEEEEVPLDFSRAFEPIFARRKSFLIGRKIDTLVDVNFLDEVPEDVLRDLSAQLTTRQGQLLYPFLTKVPMGVFILLGPAGVGKSWVLAFIILLLISSNQKVSVVAPSNVAVINISDKTFRLDSRNRLLIRPWQLFEEENAVLRWVPDSEEEEWKHVLNDAWRGHDRWKPGGKVGLSPPR
ncbi:uncharacterized protein PAC_10505 [Phialocephala subalpina]|uniref:DNA2/NAM7 helicase helicase domain-containing protein n=1 Tax=Phialocephala subalpina TaxID=576137 RepID=A0A1L7X6F8_9HELO|nr:uncharacterized protein PAC_10505 [Phialocephala subalpina]